MKHTLLETLAAAAAAAALSASGFAITTAAAGGAALDAQLKGMKTSLRLTGVDVVWLK